LQGGAEMAPGRVAFGVLFALFARERSGEVFSCSIARARSAANFMAGLSSMIFIALQSGNP